MTNLIDALKDLANKLAENPELSAHKRYLDNPEFAKLVTTPPVDTPPETLIPNEKG